MTFKAAAIEDTIASLQKNDYNAEIIERLGYTFKDFQSAVEGVPELKKLKSELDKYKDKIEKERENQRSKFNETKTPPKELSEIVKNFQAFVKENVTRGTGLKFDVTYKNLCTKENYGGYEIQSVALVSVLGQSPLSAVFKIVYGKNPKYHRFFDTGTGNINNYLSKSSEVPSSQVIQKEKIQAMLVDGGYKKLKTKAEQGQHEIRKLEDGKYVKVSESEGGVSITIEGYEELYDSWKAILQVSPSQISSMKSKVDSATKTIKDLGGNLSGSLGFDQLDYYDGTDTYETPRLEIGSNSVTLTSDSHYDIPKAWAASFRFKITLKGKTDSVKVKSAVEDLLSAARVVRWGDPR